MFRRTLALALVLTLTGLVPLPLAACAIAAGLDGQCGCPMMSQCAGMPGMDMAANGPAISCQCAQADAPFPQAQQNATAPTPSLLATSFTAPDLPPAETSLFALATVRPQANAGPPGGRAGLCVFLI
jgi:hypothetical protein